MIHASSYSQTCPASVDRAHVPVGQTMGHVAAFACLICMNFTRRSPLASTGLLFAVGLLPGLALSPALTYCASANPQPLRQAGGTTAMAS